MLRSAIKKIPAVRWAAKSLGLLEEDPRRFLLDMLPKRSTGAEIGVHLGDFSQSLIEHVRPRELHLIDPWEHFASDDYKEALFGGRADGQPQMDARYAGILKRFDTQIRAGSVIVHRAYSTDALAKLADGYLDWIYIDGNHRYEYVLEDLELSLKKVKRGGFISGDDYGLVGWWDDGVKKAVDEFADRPEVELVQLRAAQFIFRKL